jgi:hypothetical protein
VPNDLFIMLDRSDSMNAGIGANPQVRPSAWDAATAAIRSFVRSPQAAGVGVGIGFFGNGGFLSADSCNAADYAKPSVAIAALPGNALAIDDAIAGMFAGSGTPTTPALQGAIDYAKAYLAVTPGRTASVLLVTDGVPSGCNNDSVSSVATVATAAYGGQPRVKTFVVGIGDTAALDQIALAGSGGATHYIPADGDVVTPLTTALGTIARMATCNYVVPAATPGRPIDPMLVNVQITTGMNTTPVGIGRVDNVTACGTAGGWYYDNPTKPAQISLCPRSCEPLEMAQSSTVQILYGCLSRPPA